MHVWCRRCDIAQAGHPECKTVINIMSVFKGTEINASIAIGDAGDDQLVIGKEWTGVTRAAADRLK